MSSAKIERGQERFENWANWSLAHSSKTGYPKACAFARMYRSDAGDTWEGIEPDESRPAVDEDDADLVELFVRRLPLSNRRCVLAFYIAREAPVVSARRFGLSRQRFYALLDEAAEWLAESACKNSRPE